MGVAEQLHGPLTVFSTLPFASKTSFHHGRFYNKNKFFSGKFAGFFPWFHNRNCVRTIFLRGFGIAIERNFCFKYFSTYWAKNTSTSFFAEYSCCRCFYLCFHFAVGNWAENNGYMARRGHILPNFKFDQNGRLVCGILCDFGHVCRSLSFVPSAAISRRNGAIWAY